MTTYFLSFRLGYFRCHVSIGNKATALAAAYRELCNSPIDPGVAAFPVLSYAQPGCPKLLEEVS